MDTQKYLQEVEVLKRFFTLYCHHNHTTVSKATRSISLRNGANEPESIEMTLCSECHGLLRYALDRLHACPHDPKPRCRTCPQRCYDKKEWKQMASLMRYSGMMLGMIKVRRLLTSPLTGVKDTTL